MTGKYGVRFPYYLRQEAMRNVIAGTEFCIAEAKVGDA